MIERWFRAEAIEDSQGNVIGGRFIEVDLEENIEREEIRQLAEKDDRLGRPSFASEYLERFSLDKEDKS